MDDQIFEIGVMGLEQAKQVAIWGTYGKDGRGPLKWKKLVECETDHLIAIIKTQPINASYQIIIAQILNDRGVNLVG
jgi:hypothetical protein